MALGRPELPHRRYYHAGQAGKLRSVRGIDRPALSPGRGAQAGDLVAEPGPGVGAQGGIPEPGGRFVAREARMEVGG